MSLAKPGFSPLQRVFLPSEAAWIQWDGAMRSAWIQAAALMEGRDAKVLKSSSIPLAREKAASKSETPPPQVGLELFWQMQEAFYRLKLEQLRISDQKCS